MASGKNIKSIKYETDIFSDEPETTSEKILEEIKKEKEQKTINQLSEIPEVLPEALSNLSEEKALSVEQEIDTLLDKYYNGDRDVDIHKRYANQAEYKHLLIQTLRQYGIDYVEKYHYPLSTDERHIIRVDFYGTVNRTQYNKLSSLYKSYLNNTPFPRRIESVSEKTDKRARNRLLKRQNIIDQIQPTLPLQNYTLEDYNLQTSPAWNLFRLFPRFTKLEKRMLKTIQAMHIAPEHLKHLSVYDFSDILYRTYRKSGDSPDAHLFLGARQSFIKDLFNKNEAWIRDYLTRYNIHPRYIDALIKAGKSKGVTGNIRVSSNSNTCMCEYINDKADEFKNFIISSIQSDNYAEDIRRQIQSDSYAIQGSAHNFLLSHKNKFEYFIKKRLMEDSYIDTVLEQLNRNNIPSYVLNDVQHFILAHPYLLKNYLKQNGQYSQSLFAHLTSGHFQNSPKAYQTAISFTQAYSNDFFISILEKTNSADYARFTLAALNQEPILNDYTKDMLSSFAKHNRTLFKISMSQEWLDKLKNNTLDSHDLAAAASIFNSTKDILKNYFKAKNVLTFDELRTELIDAEIAKIKNSSITAQNNQTNKHFILSHADIFKNWYLRHMGEKSSTDTEILSNISQNGISTEHKPICDAFIRERLSNFMQFAVDKGIPSVRVIKFIQKHNHHEDKELNEAARSFIIQYGATFKNFLQQTSLRDKEKTFAEILQKIKAQGFSKEDYELAHRFIIDNTALYAEYLQQGKHLNNQTEKIYSHIINNKGTNEEKNVLKAFLHANIYDYLIFQQDEAQLLPHAQSIISNAKNMSINPETRHWLKAFALSKKEDFRDFLSIKMGLKDSDCDNLIKHISSDKNSAIDICDGYVLDLRLTVHHKHAIKDSGDKKIVMENIAGINNFSNLCLFTEFWHKVMHSLDCTEPVEGKERFVSRLMPQNNNIVIFGGSTAEDQLCYDYENDPRTQRTNLHLQTLLAAGKGVANG